MKVCIIVDDYMSASKKTTAKMMHELSVEFVKQGKEVTVITPDSTIQKNQEISKYGDVTVCRFRSGEIKNVSKFRRFINEFLLSYRAWSAYKEYFKANPHDLIVYWSPSIFWSGLVKKLKILWNAPGYMLLRDFFPQWVIDNGMLRERSLITRLFRYYEKVNYKNADMIALQSPKNIEWFSKINSTNTPLDLLYNWANDVPIIDIGDEYRKLLSLEGKVVFFYGGNIGHAQDMMNIVRLAENMSIEETAHFVLVGRGDEFELIQQAINNKGLGNITLLPAVCQDEFKVMLSEFDVGLFSLHRDHTTHNFPGKILAYMVQGIPILGSINNDNDLKEVIEDAKAGFVTINGEDDILFKNACMLLDEPLRESMGKDSKRLLHNVFSVEAAVGTILKYYNNRMQKIE